LIVLFAATGSTEHYGWRSTDLQDIGSGQLSVSHM